METLWASLRYGVRLLYRDRTVTLIAVVALGVSIGSISAMFSAVDAVLLRPLPYPNAARAVVLLQRFENGGSVRPTAISAPEFADYRDRNRTLERIAAWAPADASLTGIGDPERVHAAVVTPDFFRVFGVQPVEGRWFVDEEGQPGRNNSIVLAYGLWQRRFGGNRSAIGSTVSLNGRARKVVGVMPASMNFPGEVDVWLPLALTQEMLGPASRPARNLNVVALLRRGMTAAQARQDIEAIVSRFPDSALRASVAGMRDWLIGDVRPTLLVLLAAACLVLLIGCGNVACLLLARASARRQEVAIRAALGAGTQALFEQFVVESVLLALAGGVAGLLLTATGVPLLRAAAPAIPRLDAAAVDLRVVAFTFAIALAAGLLFGMAPAFGASRALGSLRTRSRRLSALRSLAVVQLAITFVLLAGAGLLTISFARLAGVDPGFQPGNVLSFEITLPSSRYSTDAARSRFFRELVERLKAVPGVRSAAAVSDVPFAGESADRSFIHDGMSPDRFHGSPPSADHRRSTPDYFRAMGIPLRAGRFFDDHDDAAGAPVAIVNETLARSMWPGENPIGRRINFFVRGGMEGWRTVAGVVGDVRHRGLDVAPRPEIHVPFYQSPAGTMAIVMGSPVETRQLTATAQRLVFALDRDLPVFNVRPMDRLLAASLQTGRFHMIVIAVFASVTLILNITGLYGVIAHWVSRRTQELGIRMALGAQTRDVLRLVIGQGVALAACGAALGTAGGLAAGRLLTRWLYGVNSSNPAIYVFVALLLLAVALLASYIPARRAMRVDPLSAIRRE
ncbi:MAG TPA: ABC transporter permease [Bryobacteraceae bacterium]